MKTGKTETTICPLISQREVSVLLRKTKRPFCNTKAGCQRQCSNKAWDRGAFEGLPVQGCWCQMTCTVFMSSKVQATEV